MPVVGETIFRQSILAYVALALAIAIAVVLRRTALGLAIHAAGAEPVALDKSGGSAGFPSIEYPRWDGFMQYGGRHFTDRSVMQPNPLLMSLLKSKPARLWVVSCDLVDFNTPDVLAATSSSYGGCTSRVFRSLMILLCDSDANRRVGALSSRR